MATKDEISQDETRYSPYPCPIAEGMQDSPHHTDRERGILKGRPNCTFTQSASIDMYLSQWTIQ